MHIQTVMDHNDGLEPIKITGTKITEIGKKVWLFAKLQPSRARKRINAT